MDTLNSPRLLNGPGVSVQPHRARPEELKAHLDQFGSSWSRSHDQSLKALPRRANSIEADFGGLDASRLLIAVKNIVRQQAQMAGELWNLVKGTVT